jgi:hypothetical protein
MRPLTAGAGVLILVSLSAGCGSNAKPQWRAQEGATWRKYESAYKRGWQMGCNRLVSLIYKRMGTKDVESVSPSAESLMPDCSIDADGGEIFSSMDTFGMVIPPDPPRNPRLVGEAYGLRMGCLNVTRWQADQNSIADVGVTESDCSLLPFSISVTSHDLGS